MNRISIKVAKAGFNAKLGFSTAVLILIFLLGAISNLYAVTKTSASSGSWSNAATWSPAGVPASTDDVIIRGGHTVIVDSIYTCRNLDLGDATLANTTLKMTTGGYTLTITADLKINPSNKAYTYTLDANASTINIAGTFSTWGTTGTNTIRDSSGIITFAPAVSITNAAQNITFYGAGTINFNSTFTDNYNKLVTATSCVVNFGSSYIVNTTAASWAAKGTAYFSNTASITANTNLTLYNVQLHTGANTTLANATGNTIVGGFLTFSSGAQFTPEKDFEVDGAWTNNGATLKMAGRTIILNGAAQTIGGTVPTAFPNLQLGTVSAVTVACTMNVNSTCVNLSFHGYSYGRTLTITTGDTLAVSGSVTINQPTASTTNTLAVNGGVCTVAGSLIYAGTSNTTTYVGKVAVTTGTFTLTGGVTWMNNAAVATEVITVSTGIINFGTSLTMETGSGSLSVTGAGTINFNGAAYPSFNFGGMATSPVFTTGTSSILNFSHGLTVNSALTMVSTTVSNFTGAGSITPNAAVTFGPVNINSRDTLANGSGAIKIAGAFTLASGANFVTYEDFEVDGSWTNNGGTLTADANDTIMLNANSIIIGGTTVTAFPVLQIGSPATSTTESMTMNNRSSCRGLVFSGAGRSRTLTIAAGVTFTVNGDLTINQSIGNYTNNLAVNAGTCTVSGNLSFVGTDNTTSRVGKVTVTSGSFTLGGTVTWMSNTVVATEVITVSTGTINFTSSQTMGSNSGTITVSSTGTINFNGTTAPSFNFGGAATAPVFTAASGSTVNFAKGFTNNTNILTLTSTSNCIFTGNGAITPNANIVFGKVQINAQDTLNAAAGTMKAAGIFTLASGSKFITNQNVEIANNWVNNGGTLDATGDTVILNGTAQTISGMASTAFTTLQMGNSTAVTVVCTMNNSNTCNTLLYSAYTKPRTFTIATGCTLAVSGDIVINQPTAAGTNVLSVSTGTCTVGGNLIFAGTNNTTTYIGRVTVTTGTFTLNGNITWMSNTAVATEVISLTTGTINLANSLTMGTGSGTLSVSGAGTVNFNGTTAPSFNFGGAATSPSFTTAANCVLNFKNGFTNNTASLTLAYPSTANFTGTGTITPNAAVTFSTVQINSGTTLTAAGNISVKGNWTNNGTFVPGTYTVTFNTSSPNTQTITRSGGEAFYKLTASTAGTTLILANDVTITNTLSMSGANINMNGNSLILGSNAAGILSRSAGIAYGGYWKRWVPSATALTSTSGNYYGLFPIGTATDYRPLTINTTANATTAGYINAWHTDGTSITLVTYTDNEGATIQDISDMQTAISTVGLAGGIYTLNLSYTGFASTGVVTDLKLETYTGSVMGSVGTTVATSGTVAAPTVKRSGITGTQLTNVYVIGSKNKTSTPIKQFYYSRKNGNWNDATIGNGTWSYTSGGAGASCDCIPSATGNVVVSTGHTVTVGLAATADYLDISDSATVVNNALIAFTINKDINLFGTGRLVNSGTWGVSGNMVVSSTARSSSTGTITITKKLTVPLGSTYTQSSGTLNLGGDVEIKGTMEMGANALNFTGSAANISGTGVVHGSGTVTITGDKTFLSGSNLTFGTALVNTPLAISGTANITNYGTVKIYGNLTGSSSGSTWINGANSILEVTGTVLNTGTLNASTSPNTVKYSGTGAQTIKVPATTYYKLDAATSGTKALSASITVDEAVTISDSAIVDMNIYSISGNADLNMSGVSELKLQRSTNGTFPVLAGDFNLIGGTVTINQTAGNCTLRSAIYNNVKFTGSRPYDISGISTIHGDLDVQGSSTIINNAQLTLGGTFTYASSALSTLTDDISAGAVVLSSGTLDDGGNTITLTSTNGWRNNGGTFTTTGATVFTGTTAQSIWGSQATAFNILQLNGDGGVSLAVSPAAPTTINESLVLTHGILYTDAQNILKILTNGTSTSGSDNSFVSGPMIKLGNDDFIFPVGKGNRWRRVGVSELNDANSQVTAEYFDYGYTDTLPVAGQIREVSRREYWMVDRAGSSDSLKLRLFWQGAWGSTLWDCNKITIAHWKNSRWNEEVATLVSGSACDGTHEGSIQTTGYVSSFSPFTFGGRTGDALPVSLLSFNAKPEGSKVKTNWATSLEINNHHFTVERSSDAKNFTEAGQVRGAGNSTTQLDYEWIDEEPLPGISYYRLKQTDFNGDDTYYPIVAVNFVLKSEFRLYPNPSQGDVYLNVSRPAPLLQLNIYDMAGREVYSREVEIESGTANQLIPIHTEGLPSGMYFVTAQSNGSIYRERLVIRQ